MKHMYTYFGFTKNLMNENNFIKTVTAQRLDQLSNIFSNIQ